MNENKDKKSAALYNLGNSILKQISYRKALTPIKAL